MVISSGCVMSGNNSVSGQCDYNSCNYPFCEVSTLSVSTQLVESNNLVIKVGGFYKNGLGDFIHIVDQVQRLFRGDNLSGYNDKGFIYNNDDLSNPLNIVEEISQEQFDQFRASVQYPEIGLDDLEIERAKLNGLLIRQIGYIGPHEGRHANLMLAGLKKISLISDGEWNSDWKELCEVNGWTYEEILSDSTSATCQKSYLITVAGAQLYATVFKKLRSASLTRGANQAELDVAFGKLFGYRLSDIVFFLKRSEVLMGYLKGLPDFVN